MADQLPFGSKDFTKGKPFIVSNKDVLIKWGGQPAAKTFRCFLCGYTFKLGDVCRWLYLNGTKGINVGNKWVCQTCDGEDVIEKVKAHIKEATDLFNGKFWYWNPLDWREG